MSKSLYSKDNEMKYKLSRLKYVQVYKSLRARVVVCKRNWQKWLFKVGAKAT